MKYTLLISAVALGITLAVLHPRFIEETEKIDTKKISQASLQGVMHEFYNITLQLKPLLAKRGSLYDDHNRTQVRKILSNFETSLDNAKSQDELKSHPTYRLSLDQFKDYIRFSNELLSYGEPENIRSMLNASQTFCINCHTQFPRKETAKLDWKKDFLFQKSSSEFETAEFYFVTRRFGPAITIYNNLIRNYPESSLSGLDLETSLQRKLSYFTRIQRLPLTALKSFNTDLKNPNLPNYIRQSLNQWIIGLQAWHKSILNLENFSTRDLVAHINKDLASYAEFPLFPSDPRLVQSLYYSGLLYERLHQLEPSSGQTPELLYSLGQLEETLGDRYVFSLSPLYFKECVSRYPKSPVARDCLEKYKRQLLNSLSEVPLQRLEELKSLEKSLSKPSRSGD